MVCSIFVSCLVGLCAALLSISCKKNSLLHFKRCWMIHRGKSSICFPLKQDPGSSCSLRHQNICTGTDWCFVRSKYCTFQSVLHNMLLFMSQYDLDECQAERDLKAELAQQSGCLRSKQSCCKLALPCDAFRAAWKWIMCCSVWM